MTESNELTACALTAWYFIIFSSTGYYSSKYLCILKVERPNCRVERIILRAPFRSRGWEASFPNLFIPVFIHWSFRHLRPFINECNFFCTCYFGYRIISRVLFAFFYVHTKKRSRSSSFWGATVRGRRVAPRQLVALKFYTFPFGAKEATGENAEQKCRRQGEASNHRLLAL